jgi:hypothetical protein
VSSFCAKTEGKPPVATGLGAGAQAAVVKAKAAIATADKNFLNI